MQDNPTTATSPTGQPNPIATEIIYEDDEIRIWNQVIGAGQSLPKHTHTLDYFLSTIRADGPLDVEFYEGTGGSLGNKLSFTANRGDTTFLKAGHIETAHKPGGEYRAILIELKQPPDTKS